MIIKLIFAAVFALFATNASAVRLIYSATTNAEGTAGDIRFCCQITVTSVADSATKRPCLGPATNCFAVINTRTKIEIAGRGIFRLSNPTYTFIDNDRGLFGFGEVSSLSPVTLNSFLFLNIFVRPLPFNSELAHYDLVSAIGPLATNGYANSNGFPFVRTNRGSISFISPRPAFATFQASLAGTVPEPTTWSLLIGGFLLAAGSLRRGPRPDVFRPSPETPRPRRLHTAPSPSWSVAH